MITKTTYICEICKHEYENKQDALDCEKLGIRKITIPYGKEIEIKSLVLIQDTLHEVPEIGEVEDKIILKNLNDNIHQEGLLCKVILNNKPIYRIAVQDYTENRFYSTNELLFAYEE